MTMMMMTTTTTDICLLLTTGLSSGSLSSIVVLQTHLTCCGHQLREGFTLASDQNFDPRKEEENGFNFCKHLTDSFSNLIL